MTVEPVPSGSVASAVDNIHRMLNRVGLLESSSGTPTTVGNVVKLVIGKTTTQHNADVIQQTFDEFLGVLEESINDELQRSLVLFGLFESIDAQFSDLQRTVVREADQQEREMGEMLSSLWTRVVGNNAARLRKFERNKRLLSNIRERTVYKKKILMDHNSRLQLLKTNLEVLRKRIVSPLVRSNDSSFLSVHQQVQGLDETYTYLKKVRETQKRKTMERLLSFGNKRRPLSFTDESRQIEAI